MACEGRAHLLLLLLLLLAAVAPRALMGCTTTNSKMTVRVASREEWEFFGGWEEAKVPSGSMYCCVCPVCEKCFFKNLSSSKGICLFLHAAKPTDERTVRVVVIVVVVGGLL